MQAILKINIKTTTKKQNVVLLFTRNGGRCLKCCELNWRDKSLYVAAHFQTLLNLFSIYLPVYNCQMAGPSVVQKLTSTWVVPSTGPTHRRLAVTSKTAQEMLQVSSIHLNRQTYCLFCFFLFFQKQFKLEIAATIPCEYFTQTFSPFTHLCG